MPSTMSPALRNMISRLDEAVGLGEIPEIAERIKNELSDVCVKRLELPERFLQPKSDSYARRLLHRNDELGYTVVVMTWGAGQQTPLHDHAGIWCVECVVQGGMEVTQFDLREQVESRYRFQHEKTVKTGVGDAGCLIPPFEYHILSNAGSAETSITMHVYGGEMDHCSCFEQQPDGWYKNRQVVLTYDD